MFAELAVMQLSWFGWCDHDRKTSSVVADDKFDSLQQQPEFSDLISPTVAAVAAAAAAAAISYVTSWTLVTNSGP